LNMGQKFSTQTNVENTIYMMAETSEGSKIWNLKNLPYLVNLFLLGNNL
jgi:hypothetical protein